MLTRRNALFGLLAAPVIIKTSGLLMPIKPLKPFTLPVSLWSTEEVQFYYQDFCGPIAFAGEEEKQYLRNKWPPDKSLLTEDMKRYLKARFDFKLT